jgi:general secretion pathway protein A
VPGNCRLAYIFNPKLTVLELLETICHEFGVAVAMPAGRAPTVKDYLDPLNAFLLDSHAAGRNSVLVIDEAQNLSADVLEQLRLLTNLETSERKLLQIILIGQPELRTMLARPELEQLAQRVIARYHLRALGEAETTQYIRHRLEVSGLQGALPFDRRALRRIHARSGGIPRRINLLCDRALLGAFATGQSAATGAIVDRAAGEVFDDGAAPPPAWWRRPALAGGLGLVAGAGLLAAAGQLTAPSASAPQPAAGRTVALPARVPTTSPSPAAVAARPAEVQTVAMHASQAAASPALWSDERAAWRELAQIWKLSAPADTDPCRALAREQVHCFSRKLNLPLIRQLERPGIVTLDVGTGKPSYAILSALTASSATLQAAGTEQTVTLTALAERWQGDFATLWRVPEGGAKLAEGQGGPAVAWIADGLARARGVAPKGGKPLLDAALRSELRAFQLAQGLPADGQPGPLTYMQLNRVAGVDEPRLRTAH